MEYFDSKNWQPLILPLKLQSNYTGWAWRNFTMARVKNHMNSLGFNQHIDYQIDYDYNLKNKDFCMLLNPDIEQYRSWIVLNWKEEL